MKAAFTLPPGQAAQVNTTDSARLYILSGLVIVVLLFGGLLGWSATATIGGAVIAPGTLAVESNRKSVEHLEGGVVSEILVGEGDKVRAGQVLIRLDDTIERTNLTVVVDQLHELGARHARLRAELDGSEAIRFGKDLLAFAGDDKVRDILDGQSNLFAARRASRAGQLRILEQQTVGFRDQIKGLEAQRAARSRQIELIRQELAGVEKLHKKGYAPLTRLLELKRQASEIEAQRARHTTDIAKATNSIGEVELQAARMDQDFRETASEELRDVQVRILNLTERRAAAAARLARIEITSPQAGRVLALKAHTIGGVIQPGEPIMEIVPGDDDLVLEAQVLPRDMDKVRAGQSSRIRFSAFDQQVTPEILGTLESVSADRLEDTRRGVSYFVARIRIDEAELAKLGHLELVPGMPAEIFIQTGDRLAISYLLKPLMDNFTRAFKDG